MAATLSPSDGAVVVSYVKYVHEVEKYLKENGDDKTLLAVRVQSIPLRIEERDLRAFKQAQVYRFNKYPSFAELVAEEVDRLEGLRERFIKGRKEQVTILAWVRYCFFKAAYQ